MRDNTSGQTVICGLVEAAIGAGVLVVIMVLALVLGAWVAPDFTHEIEAANHAAIAAHKG